jgi:hypothetical protein
MSARTCPNPACPAPDISGLRADAVVCRRSACRKWLQRACDRIDPETGVARGHTHPVGRCDRCGKTVKKRRSEFTIHRLRRPMGDPPDVEPRSGGRLMLDHSPGPIDRDIYGYGEDLGVPFGERPLRVKATIPTTISDRTPDWRLVYAYRVARGDLTVEGARRKIAAIERDRAKSMASVEGPIEVAPDPKPAVVSLDELREVELDERHRDDDVDELEKAA